MNFTPPGGTLPPQGVDDSKRTDPKWCAATMDPAPKATLPSWRVGPSKQKRPFLGGEVLGGGGGLRMKEREVGKGGGGVKPKRRRNQPAFQPGATVASIVGKSKTTGGREGGGGRGAGRGGSMKGTSEGTFLLLPTRGAKGPP